MDFLTEKKTQPIASMEYLCIFTSYILFDYKIKAKKL